MTGQTLDWLLEKSDPGVRAFALRDLLEAPAEDAEVLAARRATVRHSPVKEILAAQAREGNWEKAGPGYSPKYTGTVWQVIFLGQFGADRGDRRVRAGADYVLDHSRAPQGGFSASATAAGLVHCLEGNLGASLLELGYGDDLRLEQALDWLARSITGEGIAPATDKSAPLRSTARATAGRASCARPTITFPARGERCLPWMPSAGSRPESARRPSGGRSTAVSNSSSAGIRLWRTTRWVGRASPTAAGSSSATPWGTSPTPCAPLRS